MARNILFIIRHFKSFILDILDILRVGKKSFFGLAKELICCKVKNGNRETAYPIKHFQPNLSQESSISGFGWDGPHLKK